VLENRVLRRIFGPKTDEVKGVGRQLHSGELHNLYSSPDIIRQIKARRMGWGENRVHGFGGKARRKKTTWKTKAWMRGWDQNEP
jgi:hypothetical protein